VNHRWVIASPDPAAETLGLPSPLAQALWQRGVRDAAAARRFLRPQLRDLRDPMELPDMAPAVARLQAALAAGERIVIYGDYDVDGITASALLTRVLRAAGGHVANFLPLRQEEGYGLSADGCARCLHEHRPQLLIAVDCGTGSVAEIAALQKAGVEVIVLDHHTPAAERPACLALVNPKLQPDGAPLAAVGVAFKLAHALAKNSHIVRDAVDLRDHLDLAALGTVADLVPLTGENRILARTGLERLARSTKAGVQALLEVSGLSGPLDAVDIGFRLGPRLNAAGRLADARAALELLLTDDAAQAGRLAQTLDQHNRQRQAVQEQIAKDALAAVAADDRVIVVADDQWHPGVIGIVASRLTQQFYRPAVVIGAEGKGSCRSIPGFDIVAALRACAPLLEKAGGHELAAGLTLKPGKLAALRAELNRLAATLPAEGFVPPLRVDATLRLAELTEEFFAVLALFEPCGIGNPAPVFLVEGVRRRGAPRVVGKNHLRFHVTDGERTAAAVWWGQADRELPSGEFALACVPEVDGFHGTPTVQLSVRDIRV
jgi:single-stranded-DNA-specific exonuclease